MSKQHGRLSAVYLNGYDVSPYFNNIEASSPYDAPESTGFGVASKTYIPGLGNGQIKLGGFHDDTTGATGVEQILAAAIQASTDPILNCVYGNPAIDSHGDGGQGNQLINLAKSVPVAGIITISADFQSSNGLDRTRTVAAKGTISSAVVPGTTAAFNGGTSTAQGAVGYLQTFSVVSGTPVVVIEHSVNGSSSWATLITFTGETSSTAPRAQKATVTGTVRAYQRVTVTGGTIVAWVGINQPPA